MDDYQYTATMDRLAVYWNFNENGWLLFEYVKIRVVEKLIIP